MSERVIIFLVFISFMSQSSLSAQNDGSPIFPVVIKEYGVSFGDLANGFSGYLKNNYSICKNRDIKMLNRPEYGSYDELDCVVYWGRNFYGASLYAVADRANENDYLCYDFVYDKDGVIFNMPVCDEEIELLSAVEAKRNLILKDVVESVKSKSVKQ